jgi:hypothetical protein
MVVDTSPASRERGVMTESASVRIELTAAEVDLLTEALDCHEYWQLSDPTWRSSGYVIVPGEDVDLDPVESLDEEHRATAADILEARRLQERLRVATVRE